MAILPLHYGYVVAAAPMPRESGEWLCYDCRASQERINVSVVPTAPSS